jgi:hypothetical protein
MIEKEVENYLVWHVERMGGKSWKFASPGQRGVADRIVCLPDGQTWFIELKRPKGGKLSVLQQLFGGDMLALNQKYCVLWNKGEIDAFIARITKSSRA